MQHAPDVTSSCLPQWCPGRITWPRGACALRTVSGAIIGFPTTCTRWRLWAVTWAWAWAGVRAASRMSTPQCTGRHCPSCQLKICSTDPGEWWVSILLLKKENSGHGGVDLFLDMAVYSDSKQNAAIWLADDRVSSCSDSPPNFELTSKFQPIRKEEVSSRFIHLG